ncbi:MAG: hypothetical protein CMJ64_07915 [Planctomycetaceae bacterium]|nr:hypothetical protein [Planctomycetaceae bacterium]
MSASFKMPFAVLLCALAFILARDVQAQRPDIPDALKPWEDWATWKDTARKCPPVFNNADDRVCFWPSQLSLSTGQQSGSWKVTVVVFAETWLPLPGSEDSWPLNVVGNGESVVVVDRQGRPAVRLPSGRYELSGKFAWDEMPQRIAIPQEIGILSLFVEDKPIPLPDWDAEGHVWLKRSRTQEAQKDLLTAQVYRVIEDGIPIWLRTDVELTVSGKSREEDLGWILPAGWLLSRVDSPLPVAVDEEGRMKAQVRAGKWTISLNAFHATDTEAIQFSQDSQPVVKFELIGFRAKPEFRLAELVDLKAVDVTQTTFPERWRDLPVYQWETTSAIRLVEKMRGMGLQRPEGLSIDRELWLDEDGHSLTYHDVVSGRMQQIWRLDSATGQQLGAVSVDGHGQLITSNPSTGAHGVEIRTRNLNLEAIGRVEQLGEIPATGWQTDADSLGVTLHLPPGWRVLALFGADNVEGDWLTAWSLLDLFLLLIFALAVYRLWGIPAGILAFVAFGLAYHEPGAPRLTWLFLLIPLGLLRVVPEGTAQKWIQAWKYIAIALFVINLAPFLARQIQSALYPQLESSGVNYTSRSMFQPLDTAYERSGTMVELVYETDELLSQQTAESVVTKQSKFHSDNLLYDPKARIQTGPAQPEWSWNRVECRWDGPVTAGQQIRPILISRGLHRLLTVVRITLLTLLAAMICGFKFPRLFSRHRAAAVVILPLICCGATQLEAQEFPSEQMLQMLRERLLQPADAFPRAAEIPSVQLKIEGYRVTMDAEIHTAVEVAVPLPGRLPTWSPISVSVDGEPTDLVCRKDGYLWVVLPQGVHQVIVETRLPEVTEWHWTFLLKPRTVSIDAAGWIVTGVRANGVPEQQVFFVRQQPTDDSAPAYDRKDFNAVVAVNRHLETGLIWQVQNEVTRISPHGKAVSLKVPLLAGESVLTPNVVAEGGFIEVQLGANEETFSWVSELPMGTTIQLTAAETNQWVERWHLVTSPVWNVTRTGLAPIFESQQQDLVPVWYPWPGEDAALSFSRPQAVMGDTITVQRVHHETTLGSRQRTTELKLELECSLGGDFSVKTSPNSEVSSVQVGGQVIPVRRDGEALIIPVQPGEQTVEIAWRTNEPMQTVVHVETVELPVEAANVTSILRVPESRWVLWTSGPTRGPAVRFWVIVVFAILVALVLGGLKLSPLGRIEWVLLAIGLTQVHIAAALIVVAWIFLLAWRGRSDPNASRWWLFNLRQVGLVLLTLTALSVLVVVVGAGLLGNPEMFIVGNGSSQTYLGWFQPRATTTLPDPEIVSISVWFYRLLMLFWALWLAAALLRWLASGWKHFSHGGSWLHKPVIETIPVAGLANEDRGA